MRNLAVFVLLALLTVCSASPVYAVPVLPHAFYGSVTVNGDPAADGTQISATVDNGTIMPTQNPVPTKGGSYGVDMPRLLVQGDIAPGAVITFHVTNADGTATDGTYVFEVGGGPTEFNLDVTITRPRPTGGDGGPTDPTYLTVRTDFCGRTGTFPIDRRGKVMKAVEAGCKGGDLVVEIGKNTMALDKKGKPLSSLTVVEDTDPPPMPEGKSFIGLPYKLSPSGATFDPALVFTWSFDPEALPEGVAPEDLSIVVWDGSKWAEVPGVLDPVNNVIVAEVDHFTTFAMAAAVVEVPAPPVKPVPTPAAIGLSGLTIEPAAVGPGDLVTVTVTVSNTGERSGTVTVVLLLDGQPELQREVTVSAGKVEVVTFVVSREEVGTHAMAVGDLTGSFTVDAPTAPPPDEEKEVPVELIEPTDLTWVYVGIGAGLAVILVLVFLLRRRKRRAS